MPPKSPLAPTSKRNVRDINTLLLQRSIKEALKADTRPVLLFFAGANGSGKSTLFETYRSGLPDLVFVNADLLARLLAGIPERDALAQGVANLTRLHLLAHPVSFATETVFSDPGGDKISYLRQAEAAGYHVVFIYTVLASWQLSLMRVRFRVSQGGHGVPEDRLERRFVQSRLNASEALKFVETGIVRDNSVADRSPAPMALVQRGTVVATATSVPDYVRELLPAARSATRKATGGAA